MKTLKKKKKVFSCSGSDASAFTHRCGAQKLSIHTEVHAAKNKQTNKLKYTKKPWVQDTYRRSDWRQLHEPVGTDGADVPGCPGCRVRCGHPRSNQQPGIHSTAMK